MLLGVMVETEEILYLPHSMQLVEAVEEDITKDHMENLEVLGVAHLFGMVIPDLEPQVKVMLAHKKLLEETEVVEVEVLAELEDY